MNLRRSIFEKNEDPDSKLNKVFIYKSSNNIWSFKKDGRSYGMTPALITQMTLSPIVASTDRVIQNVCSLKNIQNPCDGFYINFSTDIFSDCDVRLEYKDTLFDGWIYDVFSEKLKVDETQKIWACTYLNLYFEKPPKTVYVKISEK
jgi:hypothetical protein